MDLLLWDSIGSARLVECYYEKLMIWAEDNHLTDTAKALPVMKRYHEGQYRKGEGQVPYIYHPLMMAVQAFSMGVRVDHILAAILLHDVCEDCDVTPGELQEQEGISREALKIVGLLSFLVPEGLTKAEAKMAYFDRIRLHPDAAFVKALDRCSNISTMAHSFTTKRMAEYIKETERYILPLLEQVVAAKVEFETAAYLLHYHMTAVLGTMKALTAKGENNEK